MPQLNGSAQQRVVLLLRDRGVRKREPVDCGPSGDNGEVTFAPRQTVEIVPVQRPSQLEGREAETWRVYARASLSLDGGECRLYESAVRLAASARP
jgi:hypothetical protein